MKIPYDERTLRRALRELEKNESFTNEAADELMAELTGIKTPDSLGEKELKQKIAAHHGITVEALINNPNYTTLRVEYTEYLIKQFVEKAQEKFGITEEQARAFIAVSLDLI